jgi:hypothetical protein
LAQLFTMIKSPLRYREPRNRTSTPEAGSER